MDLAKAADWLRSKSHDFLRLDYTHELHPRRRLDGVGCRPPQDGVLPHVAGQLQRGTPSRMGLRQHGGLRSIPDRRGDAKTLARGGRATRGIARRRRPRAGALRALRSWAS